MKLKWQWFLGGRVMFWVSILLFVILIFGFVTTYIADPVTHVNMKVQNVDGASIKEISEEYVKSLGITVDREIRYRFVIYKYNNEPKTKPEDDILLGTFHEWNGVYYIDISVDLCKMSSLNDVVIHETRHMLVEYLKDERVVDLSKYTENIATGEDVYYNNLFNASINLLKNFKKP